MKKFIVFYHAGMCGTDEAVGVIATTAEDAVNKVIDQAWEHFWSHNNQDEDSYEDETGSIGGVEAELDIWAEEYVPKLHDMKFVGGVAIF